MSTDNIFGTEQPAVQNPATPAAVTPVAQPASEPNPVGDLLAGIKNERGEVKYNTIEEALRGAAHAQNKITEDQAAMAQLQQELITVREEAAQLKGALNVKDLIKPQAQEPVQESSPAIPTGLSEAETVELFNKLTVKRTEQSAQATNVATVVDKLKEKYGSQANEVFYKRAADMNMTNDQMNTLAATSPTAALSFFESVEAKELNPTQTSVTTTNVPASTTLVDGKLPMGAKSMLIGATSDETKAEFARHKAAVYEKFGITP